MKVKITEENKIQDSWYLEAEEMSLKDLPNFLRKLTEDYEHDHGTICHACAAAALAAAHAVNKEPVGNITGFQAHAVLWMFMQNWLTEYKDVPVEIINYSSMLYPSNGEKFKRTIDINTWEWLKQAAKEKIDKANKIYKDDAPVHSEVLKHWKNIVDGKIPFGYTLEED